VFKYVDLKKFNVEDIIGKVETRYIDIKVNTTDKIVYRDVVTGKHKYIDKKDNMINSIIHHVKSENNVPQIDNLTLIVNDKNQDIDTLLITPNETKKEDSYYVVQNLICDMYELYHKYFELEETGYFMSNKVFKPKLKRWGDYFEPQLA